MLIQSSGHEVVTALYMGWDELKNGALLRRAGVGGVEVLLTGDRSLVHEQNLSGLKIAIVVLSTNNWAILRNHVPKILAAIDAASPGTFQAIDCGRFSRKKTRPARPCDE